MLTWKLFWSFFAENKWFWFQVALRLMIFDFDLKSLLATWFWFEFIYLFVIFSIHWACRVVGSMWTLVMWCGVLLQKLSDVPTEMLETVLKRAFLMLYASDFESDDDHRPSIKSSGAERRAFTTLASVCRHWRQTLTGWPQSPTSQWLSHQLKQLIQREYSQYTCKLCGQKQVEPTPFDYHVFKQFVQRLARISTSFHPETLTWRKITNCFFSSRNRAARPAETIHLITEFILKVEFTNITI